MLRRFLRVENRMEMMSVRDVGVMSRLFMRNPPRGAWLLRDDAALPSRDVRPPFCGALHPRVEP